MIILTVNDRSGERRYVLREEVISIGRAANNLIEVRDPKLSRQHCEIIKTDRGWDLRDLDSHNGTILNGRRISRAQIRSGDHIYIGLTNILFEERDVEENPDNEQTALLNLMEVERERGNLRKLLEISLQVNRELDLQKLLDVIVDAAIEVTGAERGLVVLQEDGKMRVAAARNLKREHLDESDSEISFSILRDTIKKGITVVTDNAGEDRRFDGSVSVHGLNLRSIICLPIKSHEGILGVVYLDNRLEMGAFSQSDLRLVEAFGNQVGIALENAQLYERVKRQRAELEKVNIDLAHTVEDQTRVISVLERGGRELPLKYDYEKIVGSSRAMRDVFSLLDKVTESAIPVLIQSESGTGKELCARAIHYNGPRRDRPFVGENCAALPETLLESELFGHVKGAFTGADRDRKGLFEMADKGTLFLDEVADMSPSLQAKLLRVLETGEVRPIGGKEHVNVDVRIIATSNKDLKKMVDEGDFREDLYYRLNGITVVIPPLRERREDIPQLVECFLAKEAEETEGTRRRIDKKCVALMTEYDWPGNVRELENEVKRLVALSRDTITPLLLSDKIRSGGSVVHGGVIEVGEKGLKTAVQQIVVSFEREAIVRMLEECGWKKSEAARRLKISRPTLDAKMEAYQISKK